MLAPRKFKLRPSEALVLVHHIVHSPDADNDADRLAVDLIKAIDKGRGWISKAMLEAALYCCNLEDERGKFWHPYGKSFEAFLNQIIPWDQEFNRYYNQIDYKEGHGLNAKTRR